MTRFISTFFYTLFILLLLSVAGLFLATLLPIPGNVQVKIVKSGSMEPAIHTGSIVIIKPQSTYNVGDVITFGEDTGTQIPTTHRIVAIHDENGQIFYQTKGDANEEADTVRILKSEVEGKVIFTAPFAGYVLDFAKQPVGFTLMIAIPAGIIILDELVRIFQEVRRLKNRKGGLPGKGGSGAVSVRTRHTPPSDSILDLRNSYE